MPATRLSPQAQRARDLIQAVNKVVGEEVLQLATNERYKTSWWPTGLLPIDQLLGGGMPRGRFVEVYGDYSTLKSYIGLRTIASVQQRGGVAAVIDTEHAFDEQWASNSGVNLDELIIERPKTGELAMDTADVLLRGGVDFINFDSIAATLPQDESKKRMHDENLSVARLAALMSAACRKLTSANDKTAMMWINQTRINVGQFFGDPTTTSGGKAMGFYASYRLKMTRVKNRTRPIKVYTGEGETQGKETYAQQFKAELVKSKLSSPHRDTYFDWSLEMGAIDLPRYLRSTGYSLGLVKKKGNRWLYNELNAASRDVFDTKIGEDPMMAALLENDIREQVGLEAIPVPVIERPRRRKINSAQTRRPRRKTA